MLNNLDKVHRKAPEFQGVVQGGTALLQLDPGYKYHALHFEFAGAAMTVAKMDEIRVKLNDKVIIQVPGAMLNIMNKFDNITDAATTKLLSLFFDRKGLRSNASEQETAINLGAAGKSGTARSLSIEIDLASDAGADVSLKTYMDVSPAVQGAGAGTVRRILPHYRGLSGAGILEVRDIKHNDPGVAYINRIWYDVRATTGKITQVVLERGNRKIWERTKARNEAFQKDIYKHRTPQTDVFCIDTTEDENGFEMIQTVGFSNFSHAITLDGAAASFPIYMDTLGTLAQLD